MANLAVGSQSALPNGAQAGVVLSATVDFSKNPLAGSAVHEIINVPKGTYVARVSYRVIKADTGATTRTFSIGDGAGTSGYAATIDAKTIAHGSTGLTLTTGTPNTVTGYTAGKFYATADTIDILAGQDLSDAIVEVKALAFAL